MQTNQPFKILFSLMLAACASEGPEPFTTLAATESSSQSLGVTAWEVADEAPGTRVITGRDDGGATLVEAAITRDPQTPDTRVHIDVRTPDPASFDLLDTGEVIGEASPTAQQLARVLYSDLGRRTTPLALPVDGLGTTTAESSLYVHGSIILGWSMFGYAGWQDVGATCRDPLKRSEDSGTEIFGRVIKCTLNWRSPSRSDCFGRVQFVMGADSYGTCLWEIMLE